MNRRVLISIANYGDQQLHFLEMMLASFSRWGQAPDIFIDTTVDLTDVIHKHKLNIRQKLHSPDIQYKLPFEHRAEFARQLDHYDWFLYTENDLNIPESAIEYIANASQSLEPDEIIGFLRYEVDRGSQYLTDFDFKTPITAFPPWSQNGHTFFTPFSVHSGCYLVSKGQLSRAIRSGGYLVSAHTFPYGMLEQGASDIYTQCSFKPKVLPVPVNPVLIHHLPDKYIKAPNGMPRFTVRTLDLLSEKVTFKPQLEAQTAPHFLFTLRQKIRYNLRNFERTIRQRLRKNG